MASVLSARPNFETLSRSMDFKQRIESIHSFEKEFEELIELTEMDLLIVFIDDLDRCKKDATLNILEAIKYDTEYYCPSDQDNDGICDNFDSDKDGDGIPNSNDGQPCGTGIGFADIPSLFLSNNFHVVGELAKCNDVLGTANISWIYGYKNIARPEGKTDLLLIATEHYTGNLIIVGGPAINPVADEFDQYFDIAYNYDPNPYDPLFQIFADGYSITLDLDDYPNEDICIVYLGRQNNRLYY